MKEFLRGLSEQEYRQLHGLLLKAMEVHDVRFRALPGARAAWFMENAACSRAREPAALIKTPAAEGLRALEAGWSRISSETLERNHFGAWRGCARERSQPTMQRARHRL